MSIVETNRVQSVFVGPGQGGQRERLIELTKQIPEVGETYDRADQIIIEIFGNNKKINGKSLTEWATVGTKEELSANTVITQPLVVATTIGLIKYLKKHEKGITAYGHSVGELAALYAAGCMSENDTLGLAMLRGVYSFEASQDQSGLMAALINVPHDFLEKIKFGEAEGVVVSTTNSPDQFTISGYADKVRAVALDITNKYQRVRGLTKDQRRQLPNAVILGIGSGFHSFMMKPAQKAFRDTLTKTTLLVPSEMNYFSNFSHDYEGSPDTIKHGLVEQLVNPVDFWKDIGKLVTDGHIRIIEIGPGKALSTELKIQQTKGNLPKYLEIVSVESDILRIAA